MIQRTLELPYEARPQQREIFELSQTHRYGAVVAHRRWGKSVGWFNIMQRAALTAPRSNWRGAFIGPSYTQMKSIIWDVAKMYSHMIPGIQYNESELRITYNGSRGKPSIRLFGGDNVLSLKGLYFDFVVFDEFDQLKMELWTRTVRPAISDRRGKAFFIGTYEHVNGPLGQLMDHAATDDEWFCKTYKASDTIEAMKGYDKKYPDMLDQKELEDAQKLMSAEEYAREYECVRAASMRGAIFGKHIDDADAEGRISEVPIRRDHRVITAWDLGMNDATAIWFAQVDGSAVHLIDYYEAEGEGLDHYARILQEKSQQHGYVYREHIAPHDIGVRELGTGKSRLEIAARLGIRFRVLPRVSQTARSEVDERIEAGRMLIPRCRFDAIRCKQGVDALRSWRRIENQQTGSLRSEPVHDWASHGSDAFTYLAMGLRRESKQTYRQPNTKWVI